MDRRRFIRTTGGMAVAGMLPWRQLLADDPMLDDEPDSEPLTPIRVAVFHERDFPTIDSCITYDALRKALAGADVTELDGTELRAGLTDRGFDLLVMAHGSAFPADAFACILEFLSRGGSWINAGGVPFSRPVTRVGGVWIAGDATTGYHRRLGITQSYEVGLTPEWRPVTEPPLERARGAEWNLRTVYALYYSLTNYVYLANEEGSDGPRNAVVRPLVRLVDAGGRMHAAPVVMLDWVGLPFANARWILANYAGAMTAEAFRALVRVAARGAAVLRATPSRACYHAGEAPAVVVRLTACGATRQVASATARVTVRDADGRALDTRTAALVVPAISSDNRAYTATIAASEKWSANLGPGFYTADVTATVTTPRDAHWELHTETGFWVYDTALVASGAAVTAGADMFMRDDKPFPVSGTTYMAGDAHRRFLLDANPAVWMRDMAAMKSAGVNMLRTGIWTGWRVHADDDGAIREEPLRALEAFVHCCRHHDLPLSFTFFAFLPEAFGGENAYLDPAAVECQKRFVRSIVERFAACPTVMWDLINEPSFSSPKKLWQCRPNGDASELAAWRAWLAERYPAASEAERAPLLNAAWGGLNAAPATLPDEADFIDTNIVGDRHPFKALDYRLFAQDAFARWTKSLREVIRRHGHPAQLVTVGQDEGGTLDRPGPQFFADEVDFVSVHNWWFNNDLVWDSVMTGVPGRPLLVEETGVMLYETADGAPWRTEREVADLLERKLVVSLCANGAGSVEWLWNTNPYMNSDNEAAIGLLRADGSEKPELGRFMRFAEFTRRVAPWMRGARRDEVMMVIPHSNLFAPRNTATEATRRAVRAMWYDCRVPMTGVSEYRIERLRDIPKLFVLPAPRVLRADAWTTLLRFVANGATLLVTGPLDRDEHWAPAPLLESVGITARSVPVQYDESLVIDGIAHRLTFGSEKIHRVEKAVPEGGATVRAVTHGTGTILWSPLPVELGDAPAPVGALYAHALRTAGVAPAFEVASTTPILVLPRRFDDAMLYAFVSESSADADVMVTDVATRSTHRVAVGAGRTALVLVDRHDGRELARLD